MSEQTSTPKLTDQFSNALVYAELKHHTQVRKGGDIPYIGHLLTVAGLVITRSMLRDYHQHGPKLWERFNRKNPHDHLWYYGELLKAYRARGLDSWMVDELERVVDELTRQVNGS